MTFLLDIYDNGLNRDLAEFFVIVPEISLSIRGDDYAFIAWGDPIPSPGFAADLPQNRSVDFIVNNIYGHFYYMFQDMFSGRCFLGNSLFGILPLYYYFHEGRIIASDNALTAGSHCGKKTLSARFVLESVLFNYPLFNHSCIEGVMLLPSNSAMVTTRDGTRIIKHTEVAGWFDASPRSGSAVAEALAVRFLEEAEKYLPHEHFLTALTGGFDGRTLAAAAIRAGRDFSCYCFGTSDSKDLRLAEQTASAAHMPFIPVNLCDSYLAESSFEAGQGFIIKSSGTGTFTRAHYLHAARLLSERSKVLVTGNFGSEIFRAVHVPGVVISPNLYRIFRSSGASEAVAEVMRSIPMSYLNRTELKKDLESLKDDIAGLPCFNAGYMGLTRNMQFYIFVFEELFRKYFGAEMAVQSGFIHNRTPFLDQVFIRELTSTVYSGIHSTFFEDNPFRRYKGQVMYARIIRKAYPRLGRRVTDKGYSPDDLISLTGKIRIAAAYLGKRLQRPDRNYDPNGVRAAWELNHSYYESLPADRRLFDVEKIFSSGGGDLTDPKAKIYSLIFLDNYLKNQ